MYVLRENKTVNIEKVIYDIEEFAFKILKKDLKKLNVSTQEVNNLRRNIKIIKYYESTEKKLNLFKYFLLDNYQYYKKGYESPLNTFFLNCGMVFSKNFTHNL